MGLLLSVPSNLCGANGPACRRLWAWQFTKAETHGAGARIAALEGSHALAIDSDKIHGRTDIKDTSEREEQATNVVHEVS